MGSGPPDGKFELSLSLMMSTARQILIKKRAMRGTANITRQGLQGVVTRIAEDKLERIKRSVETMALRKAAIARGVPLHDVDRFFPAPDAEETLGLEDDLLDIANYCFIAISLLRGTWE